MRAVADVAIGVESARCTRPTSASRGAEGGLSSTDFLTQARLYEPLLRLPHVGLALDPERRLRPEQVHLTWIRQVGIEEVDQVVTWLADLARDNALPQKLLVLHQFQARMVVDRERLDTSRDELAIMVHVDGQGTQPMEQSTWQVLHQYAPAPLYWGWRTSTTRIPRR